MNLIEIGEEKNDIEPGDYLTVDLTYVSMEDSVFFKARRIFKLEDSPYKGSFNQGLMYLSEGDSASFILNANDFFDQTLNRPLPRFLDNSADLKINVRILNAQSPEEYEKEKALFLSWAKEFRLSEMDIITNYLSDNKIDIPSEPNGIYFLSRESGDGPPVEVGKHIWIHYEGKFLNGKFVDSSKARNAPLDFIYGNDMYVIEGLDYAVGRMREGGKAVILIPSGLGFGSSGSARGIVPPFTAMIYMVEVLKVE